MESLNESELLIVMKAIDVLMQPYGLSNATNATSSLLATYCSEHKNPEEMFKIIAKKFWKIAKEYKEKGDV